MASIVSLPQELVDAILDELIQLCQNAPTHHGNLNQNLRNCMQISRAFRSHPRRLLFSNLTLVVKAKENDPIPSRKLRKLLEGDSDVTKLVHSFRLNLRGSCGDHKAKILDEHLAPIFGLLPNLRKLILASLDGDAGWRGFNDEVRMAMFRLHDLSTLESLELSGFNLSIPIDFVARWTTLKNLVICASPFETDPKVNKNVPNYVKERNFAQMTSLHLTNFGSSHILLNAGNGAILRSLTNLKAEIRGERDWAVLWKAMRHNCTTVQDLVIHNLYSTTAHRSITSVVGKDKLNIPNLRSLVIEEQGLEMECRYVGYIANLLTSHFAAAPNIQSVCVNLVFWRYRLGIRLHPILNATVIGKDTWQKFDRKLAETASFRKLDINLHFIYDSQESANDLKGHFAAAFEWWTPENVFPILSSQGHAIVHLSLSDAFH